MFPLANMLHLFPHKFPGLCGRRFTFAFVFLSPFDCFFFWHNKMVSLPEIGLVVTLCGSLIKPEMAAFLDVRWARGFEHAAAEVKTVSSRSTRDDRRPSCRLCDLEGRSRL